MGNKIIFLNVSYIIFLLGASVTGKEKERGQTGTPTQGLSLTVRAL